MSLSKYLEGKEKPRRQFHGIALLGGTTTSSDVPEKNTSSPGLKTELKKLIEEMYKSDQHVDVYPPAPTAGNIAIPTGGLARCLCSPECTKELPQPAYHIICTCEKRWCLDEKKDTEKRGWKRGR